MERGWGLWWWGEEEEEEEGSLGREGDDGWVAGLLLCELPLKRAADSKDMTGL